MNSEGGMGKGGHSHLGPDPCYWHLDSKVEDVEGYSILGPMLRGYNDLVFPIAWAVEQ